jgi:RND family efflux transporter MFP subunit
MLHLFSRTGTFPRNVRALPRGGQPVRPSPPPALAWLLTTAAALVLVSSGCSKASGEKPVTPRDPSVPVAVAKVEVVPIDRTLPVVGTLFAREEAVVAAQVEGQVEKTKVDFGDRVVKGRELALIDTASYEARALQSAANVARARATALNAEQNLKRVIELQKSRISSASEMDQATAQAEQARAEVKAAEAAEVIARLDLERSRALAPFAAAVSERVVNAGDYVKIGGALYKLVNDTELKFIVQAPERYAGQVRKGQLVRFTVDAWPGEEFQGKVYLISPSVSTATRAFNVGALISNPDGKLKANTFARGELVLETGVPTPVVPLDAVVSFAGVTKVFVIENDVARSREVKTGRVQDGRQEVMEGLKAGEVVAVSGQTKLYEGAKIRLLDREAKTAGR